MNTVLHDRRNLYAGLGMAFSFLLLRAGYAEGWRGFAITLGLTGIEVFALVYLDSAARRHLERKAEWMAKCGDLDHRKLLAATAEAEWLAIKAAAEHVDQELRAVAAKIQLRRRLAFDLAAVSRRMVALALEGYYAGIDANKVIFSFGTDKEMGS